MKFSTRSVRTMLALGVMATLVHAADYSTWARYRPVTLSTAGMGLSAAVTNIPISVRFKASKHADMLNNVGTQVQADGSDIRVTKADGTTDVPFEIEYLKTGADGALHLWVLADNVPANNATAATYRVYWGKTGETSASNPAAVFPASAGYQAVFHLNDTTATIVNAANAALNGTATGTSTTTGQQAGNGFVRAKSGRVVRAFGTSNDGITNDVAAENFIKFAPGAGHPLRSAGPLTIEGWLYSSIGNSGNTSAGTKHIVAQGNAAAGGKAWFARTAALDGSTGQNHYSAGGPNNTAGPIAPWGEQHHWQFVAAVWDGTHWSIYRNRENDYWNVPQVDGPTGMTLDSARYKRIAGTAPVASASPWYIGGASTDAGDSTVMGGWQGWMDEVRISNVARDSNYIKLTFLTSRADTLNGVTHPVAIGATEVSSVTGPYATWTNHRTINLNTTASGANVTGNVTHFPVLIRLGEKETDVIAAANGGNSIRFSKMDDATALPYHIEHWSANSAAIWVKVDTVYGNNALQAIRMHWGNGAVTSESNGKAVFDTARGYVAVWQMNGTATDSNLTGNTGLNAVATGSVPAVAGLIGNARSYADNTANYLSVPNSASGKLNFAANNDYTLTAWVYSQETTLGNRGILNKGNDQWLIGVYGGGEEKYYDVMTRGGGTWNQAATSAETNPITTASGVGVWRQIVGVWKGSGTPQDTARIYIDGALANQTSFGDLAFDGRDTAQNVYIGALWENGGLARPYHGLIDHVTVSNVARDSNWVKLSYENQKEFNALASIGNPDVTAPGAPTGVVATADTARATVTWVAPANTGGRPILEYIVTVVGDTLLTCSTTSLSCVVPGLEAGTPYAFVVRARNVFGRGPSSDNSNIVTPVAPIAPTAPQGVTATTVSSSAVNVTWTAPSYNGGSPITGYTVTASPGGATCMATTQLTCQVQGLTQGTTYTFTVTASNVAGTSVASASATATTTSLLPGAFVISMNGARNPYTYRLPASVAASTSKLTMSITDVQGKRIWSQTVNPVAGQNAEITWNGVTSKGRAVAPGLYVVKIAVVMNGKTIESVNKAVKQ